MIKMRLEDFVQRKMNLAYESGQMNPEYVDIDHPHNLTNQYYGKPVLLLIYEPVQFDRFLQGEAGAEYIRQMTLWFERWTDNEIVSHIVLSLDHDYQQVNFRIFFSTDRSMNGGHVPNHSGEWSSHT